MSYYSYNGGGFMRNVPAAVKNIIIIIKFWSYFMMRLMLTSLNYFDRLITIFLLFWFWNNFTAMRSMTRLNFIIR